jgi:hypothetical protein
LLLAELVAVEVMPQIKVVAAVAQEVLEQAQDWLLYPALLTQLQ